MLDILASIMITHKSTPKQLPLFVSAVATSLVLVLFMSDFYNANHDDTTITT